MNEIFNGSTKIVQLGQTCEFDNLNKIVKSIVD